jgi:acyl-homoserine lactone acylase PvdQ
LPTGPTPGGRQQRSSQAQTSTYGSRARTRRHRAHKEPRPRAEGLRAEVEALRKPLDLVLIPAAVLGVYELATAPVEFLGVQPPAMVQEDSNNRATPPGQAATGRPILADDPECAHSVPSPRYAVHLSSAGMDVIFQRPAGCSPT